jgi:hypothetical protein
VFAWRVEGRHSRDFFHAQGRCKSIVLKSILVAFSTGGTPGASRAPLGAQVGSQVDFLMVFRRPGGGFGVPLGPFGLPWATLGRPWASLWRQKWTQKSEKEPLWCTLRS